MKRLSNLLKISLSAIILVGLGTLISGQVAGGNSRKGGNATTGSTPAPVQSNCGETAHGTAASGFNNYATFVRCGTGSDANGYTVASLNVYIGTSGTTIYAAVYSDTSSGCTSAPCPNAVICSGSVAVTNNAFNVITPTGCGTLAANTSYWVTENVVSNAQVGYNISTNCPSQSIGSSALALTAGTWTSGTGAATETYCSSVYMVLNAK